MKQINEAPSSYNLRFFKFTVDGSKSAYACKTMTGKGYPEYIFIAQDGKQIDESSNIVVYKIRKIQWGRVMDGIYKEFRSSTYDPSKYTKQLALDSYLRSRGIMKSEYTMEELLDEFPQYFIRTELSSAKAIVQYLKFEMHLPEQLIAYYFKQDLALANDETNTVEINKSKLLFPPNVKDTKKKQIIEFIETAQEHLDAKNVGYLLYGDITITKLSGRILGDYSPSRDVIRIDDDTKKTPRALTTIFHELGHRLWSKHLDRGAKIDVSNMYSKQLREQVSARRSKFEDFKAGDLIYMVDKSVKAPKNVKSADYYVIDKRSRRADKTNFSIYAIKDNEHVAYFTVGEDLLNRYFSKNEDTKKSVDPSNSIEMENAWFPTRYSESSYEEWFCELFAVYIANILDGEPAEFIESIILQANPKKTH